MASVMFPQHAVNMTDQTCCIICSCIMKDRVIESRNSSCASLSPTSPPLPSPPSPSPLPLFFQLCGRTLRVDHVRQYRRPKDGDGNEIIEKGCAPKTPTPSPTPSPQPESSLPRPKVKKKKLKDRKKKQKDKKEKRKKQKKLHVPLSSKGDGGEQEDNFDKQKSIAHDKDGSLDSGAQARHRSRSPHIGKQNWSPRDHKKQRSRSPCYREDTCTTNRSRRCNKSPVHTSRRSGGHERTSTSDRRDGN